MNTYSANDNNENNDSLEHMNKWNGMKLTAFCYLKGDGL